MSKVLDLTRTTVSGVTYIYNDGGDWVGTQYFIPGHEPESSEGSTEEFGQVGATLWPRGRKYRVSKDELAIKSAQATMSGYYAVYYDSRLEELRCYPHCEIEPTCDTFVSSEKMRNDAVHRHLKEIYDFEVGGTTTIKINIIDPLTEKTVDYDGDVNIKIQKMVDGIPELHERGEVTCVNGTGEFTFNSPTERTNLIFKIKPCSDAWDHDHIDDDGDNVAVLKRVTYGPKGIARLTTLFRYKEPAPEPPPPPAQENSLNP
ncbi:MAG: hypothetical protein CMM25_08935 [Rhodospirillaceae bacterium]|nr:hypothetical protein [Rhodospirillaceae bacterium]